MLAVFIDDSQSEIATISRNGEFSTGDGIIAIANDCCRFSYVIVTVDPLGSRTGNVNLTVFIPKRVNLGALGGIEITIYECLSNFPVFQFFRLDHCECHSALTVNRPGYLRIVIVIRANAVDPFAAHKQIVINTVIVIIISHCQARAVEHFNCVHTVVVDIVVIGFFRPGRVIISDKEALFSGSFHHVAGTLCAVAADIVGLAVICFDEIDVFLVKEVIFVPVPERLGYILRINTDQADMAGFYSAICSGSRLVQFDFKTVQRNKVLVSQFIVGNVNVLVCIGNDTVPLIHIDFLDFSWGFESIGKSRVAMQVCFVETSGFGQ